VEGGVALGSAKLERSENSTSERERFAVLGLHDQDALQHEQRRTVPTSRDEAANLVELCLRRLRLGRSRIGVARTIYGRVLVGKRC